MITDHQIEEDNYWKGEDEAEDEEQDERERINHSARIMRQQAARM